MNADLQRLNAQVVLLIVSLVWGWTFSLVKESLRQIGTFSLLFFRFALAFALLAVIFRFNPRRLRSGSAIKGTAIGLALFGGYAFQTLGLNYTTATNSAFITGLSVVLVPFMESALLKRRVEGRVWIGSALSALGLALLTLRFEEGISLNAGDLLTLLCAASFGLHIVLIGRFSSPENYPPILVWQIGVVAGLSGLLAFPFEGMDLPRSSLVWRAILITSLLATVFAFWAQNRFQPLLTPGRAAVIFSTEPVFAATFGYLFLGERLTARGWIGAALILLAMLISQGMPGKARIKGKS